MKSYGVGIVGVTPPDSWAVIAHIPAIKALAGKFHIAGIANSTGESARAAAQACGVEVAFESVDALLASDAVDIVAINVRAPLHAQMVERVLAAGKHIYCEWPLGATYDETARLAELSRDYPGLHVCGSQAVVHPVVRYVDDLVHDGFVGDVLFSSVVANGGSWSEFMPSKYRYSLEEANGATLLAVPMGHTLVGIQDVFGPVATAFAEVSTRRQTTTIIETGEVLPINTPDNAMVGLVFENGIPLSLHYRGGINRSVGINWEIIGTRGELHVRGDPFGAIEMVDLTIKGAQGTEPLADMPVPDAYLPPVRQGIIPDNVMGLYERLYADLQNGGESAPNFVAAERNHRVIEAIARSSRLGKRIVISDM